MNKIKNLRLPKRISLKKINKQNVLLGGAVVVALALFIVSGWLWWTRVFTDSDRVFSDMLANNLKSKSVSRKVTQKDQPSSVDQTIYVDFRPNEVNSQTVTKLSEKGMDRQVTTVTTETIGTPSSDYVRYLSAEGAESLSVGGNLDDVLGVWAKRDSNPEEAAFLNEALFSIVPFGNLSNDQSEELLSFMQDKNVYEQTRAEKAFVNGRYTYSYGVLIRPLALVESLAKYAELTGQGSRAQLNAESYANAAPIHVQMLVDIPTRQLISIEYSNGRSETIENTSLFREITIPNETIPFEQLQQRLLGQPAAGQV